MFDCGLWRCELSIVQCSVNSFEVHRAVNCICCEVHLVVNLKHNVLHTKQFTGSLRIVNIIWSSQYTVHTVNYIKSIIQSLHLNLVTNAHLNYLVYQGSHSFFELNVELHWKTGVKQVHKILWTINDLHRDPLAHEVQWCSQYIYVS